MRKFLVTFILALGASVHAIDAMYLGGQVGHVALLGEASKKYSNAIGVGIDLGIRVNPLLDLTAQFHRSVHSDNGDLTVFSSVLTADFHFFEFNDFEFTVGAGPGFYFFKSASSSETNFGLNIGTNVDVLIDDQIRVGLGLRYHNPFNSSEGRKMFMLMMRFGYLFSIN